MATLAARLPRGRRRQGQRSLPKQQDRDDFVVVVAAAAAANDLVAVAAAAAVVDDFDVVAVVVADEEQKGNKHTSAWWRRLWRDNTRRGVGEKRPFPSTFSDRRASTTVDLTKRLIHSDSKRVFVRKGEGLGWLSMSRWERVTDFVVS